MSRVRRLCLPHLAPLNLSHVLRRLNNSKEKQLQNLFLKFCTSEFCLSLISQMVMLFLDMTIEALVIKPSIFKTDLPGSARDGMFANHDRTWLTKLNRFYRLLSRLLKTVYCDSPHVTVDICTDALLYILLSRLLNPGTLSFVVVLSTLQDPVLRFDQILLALFSAQQLSLDQAPRIFSLLL